MVAITGVEGQACESQGDLLSWEEAEWTLHSQAKVIEVDREWEGPCRKESQIQVFTAGFKSQSECMRHCEKISAGKSPPVTTMEDWETLTRQVDLISPDRSKMSWLWLSATEGDKSLKLSKLAHWPDTEWINNKTKEMKADETIWRDFYSGEKLHNWTKPWSSSRRDSRYGDNHNCLLVFTDKPWRRSWFEFRCQDAIGLSCPCRYPIQPLIRLRGRCSVPGQRSVDNLFSPKQLPGSPGNMLHLGNVATRIEYNDTVSQWVLTDALSGLSARSLATKSSYALGRHQWTISNDTNECGKGKTYTTSWKLTGCKEEGEFTCDDGQCVKMEERCDLVPDCRDQSDEKNCQLVILNDNYDKNFPPIDRARDGGIIPREVNISIALMNIRKIDEKGQTIRLQLQISLSWRERRAMYQNLKKKSVLNALTAEDVSRIWLPLIVFANADPRVVTRLDQSRELATSVTISREGNFTRSDLS